MSIVHHVDLPGGAEVRVVQGQDVEPLDELASHRPPGEVRSIPVAAPLRIPPPRLAGVTQARPGDTLAGGDVLARVGRREVRVAGTSLLLAWDHTDGSALVAPLGMPRPVHGHVRGTVSAISPDAIEIALDGALVHGVAGRGGPAHGALRVAVRDPSDELRASAIDVGSAGQVLVGGSRASPEALIRAHAMGVAAVVLSGALDKELRDFEAIQARRLELAAARPPLAILVLGGYGKVPLEPALFAWFGRHEGRLASCFADERRLYVHGAAVPPARRPLPGAGSRTIALRRPLAGTTGTLVEHLDGLRSAPSGVVGRAALVRFDDGRIAEVPLANLEEVTGS